MPEQCFGQPLQDIARLVATNWTADDLADLCQQADAPAWVENFV